MQFRDATWVGITVLAAAVLLVVGTFTLKGGRPWQDTYRQKVAFPTAQGVEEGAVVRVRGVELGSVEEVELGPDGQAVLTLRMKDDYRIAPEDSIRISGGLLGFQPAHVEITPKARAGAGPAVVARDRDGAAILQGEVGPDTDRLLAKSDRLLDNMNTLSERMTRLGDSMAQIVDDPKLRGNLQRTAANFERLSESGVRVAGSMERGTARADRLIARFETAAASLDRSLREAETAMAELRGSAADTRTLTRDARALIGETRSAVGETREVLQKTGSVVEGAGTLVADTRAVVGENRDRLREVFTNLSGSLKRLDETLVEAKELVGDREARAHLKETAENVRDATADLKAISGDIRGITGDPKVQEDLRATLAGLRDASEQAAETFRRVRGVLGEGEEKVKTIRDRVSSTELNAVGVWKLQSERSRLDLTATVPWSSSTLYRAGLFDVGSDMRFNLQAGHALTDRVWGRYGLYASRLGVGLDFGPGTRPFLSLDLFGIDNPRLDARGHIPVSSSLDVTLGLDNVFRRADPVIGLRYRR